MFDLPPASNGGLTTLLVCLAIVLSGGLHGHVTYDHRVGPHKLHTHPTPRIGGLALLLGLVVAFAYSPIPVRELLKPMIIGSFPAFFFGLAEDLSRRVRWQERLMATLCSGILVWWLTGISLMRVGVPGIDWLLVALPVASVLLTAVAVGGLCNAFNMVDGVHGLASGLALIALVGFAIVAHEQQDIVLFQLSLTIAAVGLGFLLVNFPFGKLFLGDGGAYLLGFMVAWVAVLLPARNPAVSPWASLLICAYPILEVIVSVLRRWSRTHQPTHPDGLHLHSVLRSRFTRRYWSWLSSDLQNALVSPPIWFFGLLCTIGAVVASTDTPALMVMAALAAITYWLTYRSVIGFGRRMCQ